MKDDDREPTTPLRAAAGDGDGPMDLSALFGDRASTGQWEALALRIEAAAAPELARRAARAGWWNGGGGLLDGVVGAVARFARPALVAAAAAIVIAVGITAIGGDGGAGDPALEASVDVVASVESLSEETVRQALGAEPGAWASDSLALGAAAVVRAMYGGAGDQE